jgi:hypothetical protein
MKSMPEQVASDGLIDAEDRLMKGYAGAAQSQYLPTT